MFAVFLFVSVSVLVCFFLVLVSSPGGFTVFFSFLNFLGADGLELLKCFSAFSNRFEFPRVRFKFSLVFLDFISFLRLFGLLRFP